MLPADFEKMVNELHEARMKLMVNKRHDYATKDVLSNFKRMSNLCKATRLDLSTAFGCAMFLVLLKIDRITNIIAESKQPKNESLADTYMDLHNYIDLAIATLADEKQAEGL